MIHGIGIDTVEVQRIEAVLERWQDRFTQRVFTKEEIAYCEARANRAQHYASRWAAKEAFFKALGLPVPSAISWQDIGVISSEGQRPSLILRGKARYWVDKMGIAAVHLSLTHTPLAGSAVVILEKMKC